MTNTLHHLSFCLRCAVGVQVSRPDGKPDLLGLKVLDEPAAIQSDPAVLTMQLRQASKQVAGHSYWCIQIRYKCCS